MITATVDTQVEAEEATAEVEEVEKIGIVMLVVGIIPTTINDFRAKAPAQSMVNTSGENVF